MPVFALRSKADEKTERHLNPLSVLHRVDELLAEDSIIVADGGDFVGSAAYVMRPRGPLRWLDPGLRQSRHSYCVCDSIGLSSIMSESVDSYASCSNAHNVKWFKLFWIYITALENFITHV